MGGECLAGIGGVNPWDLPTLDRYGVSFRRPQNESFSGFPRKNMSRSNRRIQWPSNASESSWKALECSPGSPKVPKWLDPENRLTSWS